MKTKTIELYEYSELSPDAKTKAHRKWIEHNDYPTLSWDIKDECMEQLKQHGIQVLSEYGDVKVWYSLSNCQGDGAMFEGEFSWNGYHVTIKHSGRYYHSNSKDIDMYKLDTEGFATEDYADEKTMKEFDEIYKSICNAMEKVGYAHIEYEDSEAAFEDACNANEYTFRADGSMENL